MSETIYVVERSTGCYEDYRTVVIGWSPSKIQAELICEKAKEAADRAYARVQKLEEQEPEEYDEKIYDAIQAKIAKIRNPFDRTLDRYDFGDVSYRVFELKEFNK